MAGFEHQFDVGRIPMRVHDESRAVVPGGTGAGTPLAT